MIGEYLTFGDHPARSSQTPSTSTLWEIPLTSMMKDMAAAVSMRAVSQTRIVEIACRSAIEEEARVREKQIGILVLGPMPRMAQPKNANSWHFHI